MTAKNKNSPESKVLHSQSWRSAFFCTLAGFLALIACNRAVQPYSLQDSISLKAARQSAACGHWKNYLPDTNDVGANSIIKIRVNFHIMNSRDSSHNYRPEKARVVLKELLTCANADLDTNVRNWRSPAQTPVLPKGYQYVLWPQPGDDGFYFHYDDSLYYFVSQGKNINNYSRKVIDKYAIGKDSILNIFIQVHPDDSIKSPTYRANRQGIALGTALKMAGLYETTDPVCGSSGLLNHEIGHILGLPHAWTEDGCPDTDNHPNKCWVWTEDPPCRDLATNNLMDYNAYQIAMTPCQIGRVHANFAQEGNLIRKCLVPEWCSRNPEKDLVIRDSVSWEGARDAGGHITIAEGGVLRLSCRLSMPANSYILVQPGGRLYLDGARLHNACGRQWNGILTEKKGKKGGMVVILKPSGIENVLVEKKQP